MRYETISVGGSIRELSSIIGTKKPDSMGCRRIKSPVPEKGSEPDIHIFIKKVNLDLWYPVPPTKGGHSHGQFTIRRRPDPPHGSAGFDQSHVGGVAAVGSAF